MKKKRPERAPLVLQPHLNFEVEVQNDVNGIEMGVLENGIAYLTQRGLGEICGISRSRIYEITKEWEEHFDDEVITKGRLSFIRDYLLENRYREPQLYIKCKRDNQDVYAYPDIVCMAILEFYAFESSGQNRTAVNNYRRLARYGLQQFIYTALGYSRDSVWKYHLDRVSILKNKTPSGCFTVFQEIAGMIVDLIEGGMTVNEKTIPDISVGIAWSKHWQAENRDEEYGARLKYEHEYPHYYPQSESNPQPAWAYPDSALSLFREWFKGTYLPLKFPPYILKKANVLKGGQNEAIKMIEAFSDRKLPR